jgi:hypothetical protein
MPDGSRSRGKPDSPSTPRHTASSGRGNRVISPCPAGPTSHEAPHQQHRTVQCAVSVKGLRAVFGARRLETARRWPTSTDLTLVDPDGSDEASRRPTGHRLGPAWVAGRVGQRADQTGRGEHRKDQTVAVQALADAAARLEQTGISQTRSARSRPVIAAAFPSAGRPVGVVRIVGVVAVVVSSSAPSHRKGLVIGRPLQPRSECADRHSRPSAPKANPASGTVRPAMSPMRSSSPWTIRRP